MAVPVSVARWIFDLSMNRCTRAIPRTLMELLIL